MLHVPPAMWWCCWCWLLTSSPSNRVPSLLGSAVNTPSVDTPRVKSAALPASSAKPYVLSLPSPSHPQKKPIPPIYHIPYLPNEHTELTFPPPLLTDLPRASNHHRSRRAPGRQPPHHTLRHRHDEMHLLRFLPGELSRRRHRRDAQRRVRHRDPRGAALQQGEITRQW